MTTTPAPAAPSNDSLLMTIRQEIHVHASLEATFAALLEQLGPGFEKSDGEPMPLKLEAWPGGRWFRDLGDKNGHCWATVQSIKRPTLLEFSGPLMLSLAVANNVQYRLAAKDGGTLITFQYLALGHFDSGHREGMPQGWDYILKATKKRAEK